MISVVVWDGAIKIMRDKMWKKPNNCSYRCDLCEVEATHIPGLRSHLAKLYVKEIRTNVNSA